MAKPSEYFDKLIQKMSDELVSREEEKLGAEETTWSDDFDREFDRRRASLQKDAVLSEFLRTHAESRQTRDSIEIETVSTRDASKEDTPKKSDTCRSAISRGLAQELRDKVAARRLEAKPNREVEMSSFTRSHMNWIRKKTKSPIKSKSNKANMDQDDVINELKDYLNTKKANEEKKETLLLELVRKFVLRELRGQSTQRIESHYQSRRVIHEFKKRQVLREIAKRSEAIKSHEEQLGRVHAELTNAYIMKNLNILNMLFSHPNGTDMHCKEHKKLFSELCREANRRSAMSNAKQMKQCFAELQRHRAYTKNRRGHFQQVIQQIRMKSMRQELLERFYERKELHEISHSVMHELIKRSVMDELKATNGSKEEFHRRKAQVLKELQDRWNWIEAQQFKQLVILELSDRCEALDGFKAKTEKVLSELMMTFALNQSKQESQEASRKKKESEMLLQELEDRLEWVNVQEPMSWVEVQDRAEWVVCSNDDSFGSVGMILGCH